ncbi:MAG: DUF3106 domain-containing protein [Desulfobacterales bacterium]
MKSRSEFGEKCGLLFLCTVMMLAAQLFPLRAQASSFPERDDICMAGWLAFSNPEMSPEEFQKLSPEEKARLKKKLEEWKSLPPEKQAEMRQRMNHLKKMPPEARRLYEQRFQQWQRLSPAEQNQIRQQLENWDSLSPEEKERVRQRFR